ncbi:hypothetical protein [Pseudomonas sp.]|uniref:hypothetical protein n=1 Tax=Pseudomonas sp. TaxID=306 RepID=UPI002736477B|nr:hypothetical protein [Pseudomonas sp.]MDP2746179.1 hypothetical protein [Pseudomonas sp.]
MNAQTLDQSIIDAVAFIKAARTLRAVQKANGKKRHPVEAGAAQRASMTLTRCLADLRQGR